MHTVAHIADPRRALRLIACVTALCAALALPAAAMAAKASTDPTGTQYADSLTGAESSAGGTDGSSGSGASNGVAGEASGGGAVGGLPFTGTDLVALAAVAFCLISTGLVFQRLARTSD
jgi:hypothetical protein